MCRSARRRYGPRPKPLVERFLSKVEKTDTCWLWKANLTKDGYGRLNVGGVHGRMCLAHRVSYELFIGPIPDGLNVLHDCDTPGCVNPEHLFAGTQADNMKDMLAKGRWNGGRRKECST